MSGGVKTVANGVTKEEHFRFEKVHGTIYSTRKGRESKKERANKC